MSDVGGITELQLLEKEVALLKMKFEVAQKAEKTSACGSKIVASVNAAQAKDGFLVTEGSAPNLFHTAAGTQNQKPCCVVS
jgi:BioD-like phosphotransacetylase family protein